MAKQQTLKPRRVTSADDRNKGRGSFLTLKKTGDQFVGHALFKPDPELKDNPGYYEYFEHYTPASGYCPCVGDECPFCAEGDNASTRAKTVWLVDGELKVFTLNYYMIQDFIDLMGEDEPILGQLFRIKRQEGQGKYAIRPKSEKLNKTELSKALKSIEDDMLEKIAIKQMRRVLDELDLADAMEEDDEDDDDDKDEKKSSKSKARKGTEKKSKGKKDAEPEEDDEEPEEPEEDEEEEFDPEDETEFSGTATVVKVVKSKNIATVEAGGAKFDLYGTDEVDLTELSKGDKITVEAEKDDDGDFVVSSLGEGSDEDEDGDGDGDAQEAIEEEVVTITSVNSDDETLTVTTEGGTEFELYFLGDGEDDNGKDWSEFDVDDFEEGQQITITAAPDDDGDMLASVFPEPVKAKGKAKSGDKKKGGKKKK